MTYGPIARVAVGFVLALSILAAVMSTRALFESRALRAQAEVSLAEGDVDLAIAQLRMAARWDAPLNTYADDAFVTLERLARAAENKGETERALSAYRAIHAAALASRGFYVPERDRVRRVDQRIAALEKVRAGADATRIDADAEEPALALEMLRPRLVGVLVTWLGFAAWVAGASVFILRGVDARGRLVRHIAKRSALFVLAGWVAFALGLRLA